jgi:hypothetical protein
MRRVLVMRAEAGLRRLLPLPFGVRCLATCVKPHYRSAGIQRRSDWRCW